MQIKQEIKKLTHQLIDLVDQLEGNSMSLKGKKIIIDAGHGGVDPGAVGPTGLKESDSALVIAHLLGQKVRDLGAETILTRAVDKTVSLQERIEIARSHRDADCFVSIHHNAVANRSVTGIETFNFYNSHNGSRLSTSLQNSIMNIFSDHNDRGVKEAGFYVLRRTPMAAALVELEFLSNVEQEKQLEDPEVIANYVSALTNGLINYFK